MVAMPSSVIFKCGGFAKSACAHHAARNHVFLRETT
jgi:hypothetical protein